jgi:hypothetical protein
VDKLAGTESETPLPGPLIKPPVALETLPPPPIETDLGLLASAVAIAADLADSAAASCIAPAAAVKKSSEKMSFKEKTELENLNKFIPEMEEKKKVLTEKLNDSSLAYDKIIELSEALGSLNSQLETAELRWLELNEKI